MTTSKQELREIIFRILNCYDIDASEVSDGMTYIDSTEAGKLSDEIIGYIEPLITQTVNEVLGLYGTPQCENLHHSKKHQHRGLEPCPVVAAIQAIRKEYGE